MKTIFLILLFIVLTKNASSQQQDFIITEGSEAEICGRIVTINGFWINDYEAKADISVQVNKMSKPFTGGYSKGDTIDITNDCKMYVVSVSKYGMQQKGKVKISSSPDVLQIATHPNEFTMHYKEKYKFGDEEWNVEKVYRDSAMIEIKKEDLIERTFYLKKNDVVWFGEYAFSVSSFTRHDILWGRVEGKIELKKVRDFSYINFPVIPGEWINAPLDIVSDEELIIRKMKYYPKKKIDKEELKNTPVKYWVLKIFYYPRGIASQVIKITRNGKDKFVEFTGYKSFDTEEEVMEFARLNNIKDIKLDKE